MNGMTIDSHVHLLRAERDYPWMVDDATASLKRYALGDLEREFAANGVAAGIVVQAVGDLGESIELLRLAATTPVICGVIGWVDLTGTSVEKDLIALRESEGGTMLVGIRHQTHDEPDPLWLVRSDVLRGLERVAETNLPFDLLIRPREVPAALKLASELPELKLVIDHLAKPPMDGAGNSAWHEGVIALAESPNVFCKLSGLTTEVTPLGSWTPSHLGSLLSIAIEVFGAARCMFGSDWPVSRLAAEYADVATLTTNALAPLAESDREAILAGNAINVYGLSVDLSADGALARMTQARDHVKLAVKGDVHGVSRS
jgi:L-fuconolactonase